MTTPVKELDEFPSCSHRDGYYDQDGYPITAQSSSSFSNPDNAGHPNPAAVNVEPSPDDFLLPSSSRSRGEASRLDDDLAVLQVERQVSMQERSDSGARGDHHQHRDDHLAPVVSHMTRRSARSTREPVDEFDAATNPLHEQASRYNPPENPTTNLARFFKKVHESSFLVRYFTYITPLVLLLLIPLLLGTFVFHDAHVGGVKLTWFSIWLEIFWLTLWAGRLVAKCFPGPVGILASLFTNNSKKWRDLARQLELPASLFFWWLGVEISFLPTMINHHIDGDNGTKHWEVVMNKIIISIFVGTTLNLAEKIIIQLIAISFHLRTYADRIEINKFQIGSLTKLYTHSKEKIAMEDSEFEIKSPQTPRSSGTKTPLQYAGRARDAAKEALTKVGDVAGVVAGDFTGRKGVRNSNHPHQVVLTLLGSTSGSQVLARRLYRTFVREGFDTVFSGDLKSAFDNGDEAEAAFTMFDKDMNGDISMEELEAVCAEIGRERKSITASLKDLDSVVSKLDSVFMFIVTVITILVFLSLISASTAGVLTSAGSTLLALSWLFSATAQEMLASVIFVFVKHPFDVGDRVSIYGNTGKNLTGDDYYVKEIALLYTEFKKMEGHVVQAPNSYLNTLFILNQRRSGALAEAVPIIIKYGTTLEQIDALRQRLLEFVHAEKREYGNKILTELREVTENYSVTLNVVFFYKSNWQNELLRLQRRNKFICNLMLCLQELGIQGPRANLAGYTENGPYHVSHLGPPPQYTSTVSSPPGPPGPPGSQPPSDPEARDRLGDLASPTSGTTGHQQFQSILRNRAGTMTSIRSTSNSETGGTRKHVDFSLGMQNISSGGDMMSDVFEDRKASRVGHVIRTANREYAERRRQEVRKQEQEDRASSTGRSQTPGGQRRSIESHRSAAAGSLLQPVTSGSPSTIQRNRFFSLRGAHRSNQTSANDYSPAPTSYSSRPGGDGGTDADLMEQGRFVGHDVSPRPGSSHLRRSGTAPDLGVPDRSGGGLTTWLGDPALTPASPTGESESGGERMEMHNYPKQE